MNLQKITDGEIQQFEIPESAINQLLANFGQTCTVEVFTDLLVLSTESFEAEVAYCSHDFNEDTAVVNLFLHRIRPFYLSMGLSLLNKKYPFLEYWKNADGNRIIACHLDKLPGIVEMVDSLKKINIETVFLEKGKIILRLQTKSGGTEGDEQHV